MLARFLEVRGTARVHTNPVFDVVESHTTSTGVGIAERFPTRQNLGKVCSIIFEKNEKYRQKKLTPALRLLPPTSATSGATQPGATDPVQILPPEGSQSLDNDLWMWCAILRHQKRCCYGP